MARYVQSSGALAHFTLQRRCEIGVPTNHGLWKPLPLPLPPPSSLSLSLLPLFVYPSFLSTPFIQTSSLAPFPSIQHAPATHTTCTCLVHMPHAHPTCTSHVRKPASASHHRNANRDRASSQIDLDAFAAGCVVDGFPDGCDPNQSRDATRDALSEHIHR